MNKMIIGSAIVTVLAVGGIVKLLRYEGSATPQGAQSNVNIADGKQIIQINAKGGYAPRNTSAKANTPTTINIKTNGTYDCSSALNIPALGFRQNLPASGITTIEVAPQQPGTVIKGICTMGMYSFTVSFN